MPDRPSPLNSLLFEQLVLARKRDAQANADNAKGIGVEVPTTGAILSSAYEQLRNAAEYAEEHLLLQRAIKRFCKLNLFLTKHQKDVLGRELIVELVQAGYLQNGRIGSETTAKLSQVVEKYMSTYALLRQSHVDREKAMGWVLAYISVEAENMLKPHSKQQVTVFLAYQHFLQSIAKDQFADLPSSDRYELCLYIAVHQALLKSDADTVRHELFALYQLSPGEVRGFKDFNEQIDTLYSSELTIRLKRIIGRYGAPFRVLKSLIDDRADTPELLRDKASFMSAYQGQIKHEYKQIEQRLNRGLIKSIIFIIITKVLIGVSIEVPYDLLVYGSIVLLPLAVNLLFPPLYMASLKLRLRPPSEANAQTLYNYMESLLYGEGNLQIYVPEKRHQSPAMRLLYAFFFAVPIVVTVLILQRISFNLVQMFIFFAFFSTASFLGFRLGTLVRELELTSRQTGLLASLRDFFYLPFIVAGQWLSRKYSKLNLVARFLDIAIELPLKAILRLVRQWIRFLNEKHDELY